MREGLLRFAAEPRAGDGMQVRDAKVAFERLATRSYAVALGLPCLLMTWAWFAGVGTASAQAQTQGSTPLRERESPTRLLTLEEGRSILNVAWQQELPTHGVRDCSHLVHEIYANAGFTYPYASSFEIYAGNENFARVRYPRAGDVVAWPGHVGIVVDPVQHRFYSLVRTGLQEMNYDSPYWRSRGRPRFYRFRIEKGAVLSAAKATERPRATNEGSQAPAMTDAYERATAASHSDRPPTASSRTSRAVYGPPAPPDLPARDAPEAEENDATSPFEIPTSVIVAAGSNVPTREGVAEGISELSDAEGSALRKGNPFQMSRPVVIVEQFSVQKVEIKHDHGWARLMIDSRVLIGGGTAQVKQRHEKVRWELRRTDSGWEALPPADRIYVPRDVAVKNLSAQLAQVAASDGAARHDDATLQQEAQIAGVLNALLEKK